MKKNLFPAFVGIGLSALSLYLIFSGRLIPFDLSQLDVDINNQTISGLIVAILIFCISYPANSWRFSKSAYLFGIKNVPFSHFIIIVWGSHALTTILPASIAMDIGRIGILIGKFKASTGVATATVIVDRLWSLIGLVLVFGCFGWLHILITGFSLKLTIAWVVALLLVLGLIVLRFVLLKLEWKIAILSKVTLAFHNFTQVMLKEKSVRVIVITGLSNSVIFAMVLIVISKALEVDVEIGILFLISPIIVLLGNLPIFYHGFGGREAAILLFSEPWVSASNELLILISILSGIVMWVSAAMGLVLIPFFSILKRNKRATV